MKMNGQDTTDWDIENNGIYEKDDIVLFEKEYYIVERLNGGTFLPINKMKIPINKIRKRQKNEDICLITRKVDDVLMFTLKSKGII